jgi:hypothetical protein
MEVSLAGIGPTKTTWLSIGTCCSCACWGGTIVGDVGVRFVERVGSGGGSAVAVGSGSGSGSGKVGSSGSMSARIMPVPPRMLSLFSH